MDSMNMTMAMDMSLRSSPALQEVWYLNSIGFILLGLVSTR